MNIEWFKEHYSNLFGEYELNYRFFPKGDFGDLEEVTFENRFKTGAIQFWEQGYICIQLFDFITQSIQMNILLGPNQDANKVSEIKNLLNLI